FYATGQTVNGPGFPAGINIGANNIATVGVNTTDGDGIQISYVGRFAGATAAVPVVVGYNGVNNVIGTGLDRDDGLTAGDGIRGSYIDGNVTMSRNLIADTGRFFTFTPAGNISNDGIQLWNVSGSVSVTDNFLGGTASIGVNTRDGDGIVIEGTGGLASNFGVAGGGSVAVSGNEIHNVMTNNGVGAPALDRDSSNPGGAVANLTAGDGIRVAF